MFADCRTVCEEDEDDGDEDAEGEEGEGEEEGCGRNNRIGSSGG